MLGDRTETWNISPTESELRKLEATPKCGRNDPDEEDEYSTEKVKEACDGFSRGEEEMEYCLTRMGGDIERNVSTGRSIDVKRSSMSSTDNFLAAHSPVEDSAIIVLISLASFSFLALLSST